MKNNFELNNLYFIDCVDDSESSNSNGLTLYGETISNIGCLNHSIDTEYFAIDTKADFLNVIGEIYSKKIENRNVLLHIYLHGSLNLDGLLANDKILITWEELLEETRRINVKTRNGLFLVMAMCYGRYIGENINVSLKAPFNSLIASKYEEDVRDIYNLFHKFYNNLIFDKNLINAYEEAHTENDKFYFTNTIIILQKAFNNVSEKISSMKSYEEFVKENCINIEYEEYQALLENAKLEFASKIEQDFLIF